MAQSKLFQVIEKLTLKQRNELGTFFQMSSNKVLERDQEIWFSLLLLIKEYGIGAEQRIWQEVLSAEELLNPKRIKSRLLKALERYLVLEQVEKEPFFKFYLLSKYYISNRLKKHLFGVLRQAQKWLGNTRAKSPNSALWQYLISEQTNKYNKGVRSTTGSLNEMEQHLSDFYAIQRMRIITEKINRGEIIQSFINNDDLFLQMDWIKRMTNHPVVALYQELIKLILDGDEKTYLRVKNQLKNEAIAWGDSFEEEVVSHLMNYCIRQVNQGYRSYAQEYLEYIDWLELKGRLLNTGFMPIGRFSNLVNAALIAGKLQWAKEFVDRYQFFLESTKEIEGEEVVSLNKALIALEENQLKECFEHLNSFKGSKMFNKDVYLKISAQKTLLKALFQQNSNDVIVLITHSNNFRKSLNKETRIKADRKLLHLRFLTNLKKLIDKKAVDLEKEKKKLLIPDYFWLEKQLGSIK